MNALIQKFANYPGFQERIELFLKHIPFFSLCFVMVLLFWKKETFRRAVIKNRWALAAVSLVINLLMKWVFDYTYDTGLGAFCVFVDLGFVSLMAYALGSLSSRFLRNSEDSVGGQLSLGLAVLTFFSFLLVTVGFQKILGSPHRWTASVGTLIGVPLFFKKQMEVIKNQAPIFTPSFGRSWSWLFLAVFLFPLLPYIFTAAPPDADTTTQTEILGMLLQGKSYWSMATGVAHEVFFIRYPISYASLSWVISQVSYLFASESQLLLWILSYGVLLSVLVRFGLFLNLEKWVVTLFSLTPVIATYQGISGAQSAKMLAYSFALECVLCILKQSRNRAAVFVSAALLINPLNALPAALIYGFTELKHLLKLPLRNLFVLVVSIYWICMMVGPTQYPTTIQTTMADLTAAGFFDNAWNYFWNDSLGFPFAYLVVIWLGYKKDSRKYAFLLLGFMFAVHVMLDGLLGDRRYPVRLTGGFSNVGLWILSMGFTYEIFKARFAWDLRKIAGVFFVLWAVLALPCMTLKPESVFATHQCTRLGRILNRALPSSSLIANIRPPGDSNRNDGYGFMMRGNTARDTVFFRITDHHVKKGDFSPVRSDIAHCKELDSGLEDCFRQQGVTHVVVDARPNTKEFIKRFKMKPTWEVGACKAFDLNI